MVLQAESAECGLACLAMIAGHHGLEHDTGSLRTAITASHRGTNLSQLMQMANALGLSARALRLEPAALGQLRTPCILHWDLDHFVVLERVGGSTVELIDPGIGRRRLTIPELSRHFTGVALELTPTDAFRPATARTPLTLGVFFGSVRNLPTVLFKVLALSMSIQALALLMPFYSQIVIDELLASGDTALLTVLALSFGFIGLLTVAISALRFLLVLSLGATLQFEWGLRLFHHLIRLPLAYFERRSVADVVSRFRSLNAVQNLTTNTLVEAVVDGAMAASTVVVMVFYSPILTSIPLATIGIYVVLRLLIYRSQREVANEAIIAAARDSGHLLESLRGVLAIKCLSGEGIREATWQNRSADSIRTNASASAFSTSWQLASQALLALEGVLVLWLGAGLIIAGSFSVGMLMAFLAYKMLFTSRAIALVDKWLEYRLISVHLDRLADITDAECDVVDAGPQPVRHPLEGRIAVRQLSFRYSPGDAWVLWKLDLTVAAGECVAISARSGAGKTTLMKLLLGLLRPESGQITVDEVPLDPGRATWFRQHSASVMQEDTLLSGTIADNVAFFDSSPDSSRLERACRLAEIHQDIGRMPMGYRTLVGDMGSALSGGQKQRLLLARALYREPQVLFLDEATSHLDLETERRIHQRLARLNVTRVMIAHRPETLRMADRILTLDDLQVARPEPTATPLRLEQAAGA